MRTFVGLLGLLLVACHGQESPTAPDARPPIFDAWAVSITSITPSIAPPTGGTVISITGSNFVSPVRVFFDFADDSPKEAFVVSVNTSRIDVLTPVLTSESNQVFATVRMVFRSGTPSEISVTSPIVFRFINLDMEPVVYAVTPTTGSPAGGMRILVFGEGFQAPVQVFFEHDGERLELQVIQVTFDQIAAITPAVRRPGQADLRIRNVANGREGFAPGVFRYAAPMRITALEPSHGGASGGTRVRISGTFNSFDTPYSVSIGGVPAQVVYISSREIIAITQQGHCSQTGAVTVMSVQTGEMTAGPLFTYECHPRRRSSG